MKNIENIKARQKTKLLEKFKNSKIFINETQKELYCNKVAEALAYVECVIPEKYTKYTVLDFDGKSNQERDLITTDIALNAKDLICKYCWGTNWKQVVQKYPSPKEQRQFFRSHSIMNKRLEGGNNVVIFGQSETPIGRTTISAIIMKEAIKLRMYPINIGQTYEWIDYPSLKDELKRDGEIAGDCRTCDWLVVDDIVKSNYSLKQRTYITELIDPFFMYRLKNKLPTILVFKFDIRNKSISLEESMGIGISNIINDNRTLKIPLNE